MTESKDIKVHVPRKYIGDPSGVMGSINSMSLQVAMMNQDTGAVRSLTKRFPGHDITVMRVNDLEIVKTTPTADLGLNNLLFIIEKEGWWNTGKEKMDTMYYFHASANADILYSSVYKDLKLKYNGRNLSAGSGNISQLDVGWKPTQRFRDTPDFYTPSKAIVAVGLAPKVQVVLPFGVVSCDPHLAFFNSKGTVSYVPNHHINFEYIYPSPAPYTLGHMRFRVEISGTTSWSYEDPSGTSGGMSDSVSGTNPWPQEWGEGFYFWIDIYYGQIDGDDYATLPSYGGENATLQFLNGLVEWNGRFTATGGYTTITGIGGKGWTAAGIIDAYLSALDTSTTAYPNDVIGGITYNTSISFSTVIENISNPEYGGAVSYYYFHNDPYPWGEDEPGGTHYNDELSDELTANFIVKQGGEESMMSVCSTELISTITNEDPEYIRYQGVGLIAYSNIGALIYTTPPLETHDKQGQVVN